jgi:hypothetical protein
MRNLSWMTWFNSFGFVTVVIFSFAFLTTMDFSPGDGKERHPMPYVLAKSESGQTLDRFRALAAARYGKAGTPYYIVQGAKLQTYAYKSW